MKLEKNLSNVSLIFLIAIMSILISCKTTNKGKEEFDLAAARSAPIPLDSNGVERLKSPQPDSIVALPAPINDLLIASYLLRNNSDQGKATIEFLDKTKKRIALLEIKSEQDKNDDFKIKMIVAAVLTGNGSETGSVIFQIKEGKSTLESPTGDLANPKSKTLKMLNLLTEILVDGN